MNYLADKKQFRQICSWIIHFNDHNVLEQQNYSPIREFCI